MMTIVLAISGMNRSRDASMNSCLSAAIPASRVLTSCRGGFTMTTWNLPDYQAEAADRMIMCKKIADAAKLNELDADALKVNRQYRVWLRWYRGQLATGYLIRMTGVQRVSTS